jgi:hypothetical protein
MDWMSQHSTGHSAVLRFALTGAATSILALGGCVHHHHEDHGPVRVAVVDEHGYHHEGYRDDNGWHGGYYDEQHQYHPDTSDWHGDRP